ncbi:MAG: 1-acyl-sn-glycerol-3-phosphate acyltransferase [Bacteroidales bacterium]|nr:1-acyl-sn-glycerol-3-phosphate acyltransferase [Bacteroidales bacterium]
MAKSNITGALERIDRRNLLYHSMYHYVKFVFFQYYSKVEVNGVEHIPRKEPVIFAPNHQNALMDALIVLFSAPQDVVFLARADIFRKKILAKALNSLKILPVFRMRDGAGELGKNEEIFDITVGVLHRKHFLCLMPEGNHGDHRRLRPLVKGLFRIAFKAQEEKGNEPYVKIVPAGLDFQDYVKQNQTLFINYGKPIEVSDYWEQYVENPPKAINALRDRLADEMKPLMIHIETETYYDTYMGLRTLFNPKMRELMNIKGGSLKDKFTADKEMITRLDEQLEKNEEPLRKLAGKVNQYFDGIKKLGIRDWVVRDRGYGLPRTLWRYFTLLVTFPVFLYGLVNNLFTYFIPGRLVKKVRDRQFHSSIKAGFSILVGFPLFYFLQTLLVGIITGPWWIWVLYLLSLYPTGKAALYWYFRLKKTYRGYGFHRKLRRRDETARTLLPLRQEIIEDTGKLIG